MKSKTNLPKERDDNSSHSSKRQRTFSHSEDKIPFSIPKKKISKRDVNIFETSTLPD